MTSFRKSISLALFTSFFCSTQISAEPDNFVPVITKTVVENIAAKCDAIVTVSNGPDYDNETTEVRENAMLFIGIERSNSEEAIDCVRAHIPTVVTALVGREKGVPPLNQEILDGILAKCKWRGKDGHVRLVEGGEVRFEPARSAKYERVDCVLDGIRPYAPLMGFVGNENYNVHDEKQK